FKIPDPYFGYVYFLPGEDLSAFGSIAASIFIFEVALARSGTWSATIARVAVILVLGGLVVASWSRAAWLTAILFLTLVIGLRLPKRWTIAFLLGLGSVIAAINLRSDREAW